MRCFRVFSKLVLLFLLIGITTALLENSFPNSVQEFSGDGSGENCSFSLEREVGSIALDCIRSVVNCWLPTAAVAGDCKGDVQGD